MGVEMDGAILLGTTTELSARGAIEVNLAPDVALVAGAQVDTIQRRDSWWDSSEPPSNDPIGTPMWRTSFGLDAVALRGELSRGGSTTITLSSRIGVLKSNDDLERIIGDASPDDPDCASVAVQYHPSAMLGAGWNFSSRRVGVRIGGEWWSRTEAFCGITQPRSEWIGAVDVVVPFGGGDRLKDASDPPSMWRGDGDARARTRAMVVGGLAWTDSGTREQGRVAISRDLGAVGLGGQAGVISQGDETTVTFGPVLSTRVGAGPIQVVPAVAGGLGVREGADVPWVAVSTHVEAARANRPVTALAGLRVDVAGPDVLPGADVGLTTRF